jgi:HNH endonuclease
MPASFVAVAKPLLGSRADVAILGATATPFQSPDRNLKRVVLDRGKSRSRYDRCIDDPELRIADLGCWQPHAEKSELTGERTLPALEATHIKPYGDGGEYEAPNGLLLRRDIHSLFDAGYVTVTPDLRFEVSRRIREEFENGKHYYALQGQR